MLQHARYASILCWFLPKNITKTADIVVFIIIESEFVPKENINFIIVSNTVEKNHLNFFLKKSKRCTWIELIYDNYSLRNWCRIVISQNIINKRRLHTSLNMYRCTKLILSDDLKKSNQMESKSLTRPCTSTIDSQLCYTKKLNNINDNNSVVELIV